MRHLLTSPEKSRPRNDTVDVLVASKDGKEPAGLEHVPWRKRVLIDSRPGWVHAANALLLQAAESGNDAIFVDDDVTILPETFAGFERYYHAADVFGFRLLDTHGQTVHAGCTMGPTANPDPDAACYIAHVTASLLYLKAAFLSQRILFPIWPGLHREDVAYTFAAWLAGFRVAYLPMKAIHDIEPTGHDGNWPVGATKRREANIVQRSVMNQRCLDRWCEEHGVSAAAIAGSIPIGVWRIDP